MFLTIDLAETQWSSYDKGRSFAVVNLSLCSSIFFSETKKRIDLGCPETGTIYHSFTFKDFQTYEKYKNKILTTVNP